MVERFINEALIAHSSTTKKTYRNALLQFQTWLSGAGTDLENFGRVDVQQYINYLASQRNSAATINKKWNAIKKFCTWNNNTEATEDIQVVRTPNYLNEAPKSLCPPPFPMTADFDILGINIDVT
ncbi:site-specific integrase [Evansella halocellulosilytica]|uniref:site-specific integrase n=1 Tax=Evansella halocellulosilytica TaxID=2011013 RepID=UPI000BB83F31|nr:site-specific integrase [Evansella halocellulosilytica]